MSIKRGDVYEFNFGPVMDGSGSEQRGVRPGVVIQNNVGNMCSPTIIVAPISASSRSIFPTHVDLSDVESLGIGSKAMLEQIRTIDKQFIISERTAVLSDRHMKLIDKAIKISLDLSPLKGGDGI